MVAGIGNIYASEILFAAGIHPQTPVRMMKKAAWQNVAASCRALLSRAIEAGGSTISDFLGADGKPGYFQLQFKVYGRAGAGCKQCGQEVKKTVLGGRATYFCPACQPLKKSVTTPGNDQAARFRNSLAGVLTYNLTYGRISFFQPPAGGQR